MKVNDQLHAPLT